MASPVFLYLSDDPQAYLLFLKDYIRSCADICHNCKVRCLENFIKTASAPDLGWNRLSPDERPRPAHTLLDAQLADLGINSSNHYGLELSDEEIDDVFQPAVRRLTLNANWVLVVEAFAAMTAYRGMGRPDRADDRYDQYKLGKKILWMACPQFTTQELVKHKPSVDLMSHWLWNLGQLLSDGADVYLSSSESQPANTALCTCPIFSILNGQYPDVYTGYEWVNVVLRAAQQRVEPALLEAWAQPLNEEELLTSSAPYRPLCPGYDCQADTSWQEDQVHKRNNVVDVPRLADVVWDWSVDQIRLLGSGTSPSDPSNPESDPVSAAVDPSHTPDSLRPGFLLLTGTPSTSASINSEFRDYHLDTFPPCRFAHFLRQDLLRAFLAHTFRLNAATCNTLPDLFVKAAFASSYIPPSPSSSSSSSHTPYLPPIKSLFDAAHRDYFHHKTLLQEIPLDKNQNRKVKPFRHPRLCRNQGAHDANGFHFRPSSWAQGWLIGYGTIDWKTGADYEDRNMRWGPQHLMRQMFDWEGGVLGWELDD